MTADELTVLVQAFAPVVRKYVAQAVQDVSERVIVTERQVEGLTRLSGVVDTLTGHVGSVRERVATLEARPPVPGPPGEPGPAGKDGVNGQDGKAGLTYLGVYQDGKDYDLGELVTWAGSLWHCNEATTTKPGEGSKAWTLAAKRGRDGKDAKDGPPGPPGPPGRDWQQVYDDTRRR